MPKKEHSLKAYEFEFENVVARAKVLKISCKAILYRSWVTQEIN